MLTQPPQAMATTRSRARADLGGFFDESVTSLMRCRCLVGEEAQTVLRSLAAKLAKKKNVGSRSALHQKWIAFAFFANSGQGAVAWNDQSVIRQGQNFLVQGIDDFLRRPARQIGAANASRKQCVSGNQLVLRRKEQADAAFGVSRRMNYVGGQRTGLDVSACPRL